MLYIDEKFVSLISSRLRNFKRKRNNLYNFSCPICGDSKSKKSKARGYFYPNKGKVGLIFKCHNCSACMNFGNFLKTTFPDVYDEYVLERYKGGIRGKKQRHNKPKYNFKPTRFVKNDLDNYLHKISEYSDEHVAKKYLLDRLIPKEKLSNFYYTKDFSAFVERIVPGKYKNLPKNDERIVIPFLTHDNKLIGFQGRTLDKMNKLRYFTIRLDENSDLLYGLNTHNLNERTYIVEGPFDSLFLPNCLAVASSDLVSVERRYRKLDDCVYVFDNEPRNKEIVQLIHKAISSGKNVCIWPDTVREKDINQMVEMGAKPNDIKGVIDKNTYSGIEAKVMFDQWRKC